MLSGRYPPTPHVLPTHHTCNWNWFRSYWRDLPNIACFGLVFQSPSISHLHRMPGSHHAGEIAWKADKLIC